MDITSTLTTENLRDDQLQRLSLELCNALNKREGLKASINSGIPVEGAKGDPITIGQIVITFLTSGAAVGLVGVLKTYVERIPTLKIQLRSKGGGTLMLEAKNLQSNELTQTIAVARKFLGE